MSHHARFLQGRIDWFHPFRHDLLKQEDGKGEQDMRDQKPQELFEARGLVNTAPEELLWERGLFEMGLQGDSSVFTKGKFCL